LSELGSYQKFEMANFGIKLVANMAASVSLVSKPLAYGWFRAAAGSELPSLADPIPKSR
jgi:hypothetical protein